MKAPPSVGKIQDIEVLRALAVMVVLWQHIDNLFPVGIPALQSAFQFFGGTFGGPSSFRVETNGDNRWWS